MRTKSFRTAVATASLAALTAAAVLPIAGPAAGAAGSRHGNHHHSRAGHAAGFTGKPIKIALITSETGIAAAEFHEAPQGFLARVKLQNAEGGVDGHKIVPMVLDDQGSLTSVQTAVQQAISDGAFGIVSASPFFFNAYKFPQQHGVPVTGGSFDGPEWGEQPNTNMFASDTGSVDPKYPVSTLFGTFMKAHGGKVLGSYGYGVSPSSSRSAIGTAESVKHAGLKVGVLDTSVPFGGVNFGTEALTAKSKHVDTVYAGLDNNSNFALVTALKQAGVKLKVAVLPTGYEPDIIGTPAWRAVQDVYFDSEFRPTSIPSPGTKEMVSALKKYAHRPPSQFPSFTIYESWLGADLMIKGLELAGKNPTQASVIKHLRHVTHYDGGGILPRPIDYSTIFGHDGPALCGWFMQAQKKGFVATSQTPSCGHDIPGTSTAQS